MTDTTSSRADSLEFADRTFAPVIAKERISSIDTLRGFALLGILLINISVFALPMNAWDDPTMAGGATGANLAVYVFNYILFRGKMLTIFSMLFGAGVILLTSRAEQRGAQASIAEIYYRRTLWLIAFGLTHAYFISTIDILYKYGLAGLVLFPLRRLAPKRLIVAGLIVLAGAGAESIGYGLYFRSLREKATAADAAAAAGATLTEEQRESQKEWADKLKELKPPPTEIAKEIAIHQGGYWRQFVRRTKEESQDQSIGFYGVHYFYIAGMMLIGMGLLKLGVFSAARSYREYFYMALFGYSLGVSVNAYVAYASIRDHFGDAWMFFDWTFYGLLHWGSFDFERLAVALGHIAALMMLCKAGLVTWLTSRLAAVGRMALTNYLMNSIVCTAIFEGYGLGLFGKMQRIEIYGVVLAVWAFQLIASELWLRQFQFGPVEWAWRSLTYWQRQPMRIAVPTAGLQPAPAASA